MRVVRFLALIAGIFLADTSSAERLSFTTYSATQGLFANDVNAAIEDAQGFLWIGTDKGLWRFDGWSFRSFGKELGLTKTNVTSLAMERDGTLWVGSWGGAFRFDATGGGSFTEIRVEGNRIPLERVQVFADQRGQVWCVADVLYRLDHTPTLRFQRAMFGAATAMPFVTAFLPDRKGGLWIGYHDLYHVQDGSVVRVSRRSDDTIGEITALVEDRRGRVWVGGPYGIWYIESGETHSTDLFLRRVFGPDHVTPNRVSLVAREHGGVWAGGFQALVEIDPEAGVSRTITREHGLTAGLSWPLLVDRSGDLWVSGISGGLQRLAAEGFSSFGPTDGLVAPLVRSIWQRRSGELIVIGHPDVVQRYDGRRFTSTRPPFPPNTFDGWGWSQIDFEDREGYWWFPTQGALVRFAPVKTVESLARPRPSVVYRAAGCFPGGDVFRTYEDTSGDIWVGTVNRGQDTIYRWNRATGAFSCYQSDRVFGKQAAPTAFLDDRHGTIWIGAYAGQVGRYRHDRFECVFDCTGLNGIVNALHMDRRGRLWIATQRAGVLRVDDPAARRPTFVRLTTANGLSSDRAAAITEDRFGRIYVGTDRGVDVLDEPVGRIHHLGTAEGLPHSYAVIAYADRDGDLWFGTLDGLARFTPPDAFREVSAHMVVFDGIRVSGAARPLSAAGESRIDGLVLQPDQRDLTIDYVGLPLRLASTLKFQYRLSETEPWSPPSANRSIVLGLPAGSYHVEIRAVDAAGHPSPHAATLSLRVLAPFYRRSWFVALMILSTLGLVALAYRARVRHLVALERQRTQIAMDLHDQMGSQLGSIAVLADLGADASLADDRRGSLFAQIAETAAGMGSSLGEIVWSLRHDAMTIERIAQYLTVQGSRLFPAPPPAFVTTFPADCPRITVASAVGRNILLVGLEALHNCARHAEARSVSLELSQGGRRWLLTIRDDGKGIDAASDGRGFGLETMRRRADEIGASLEIASTAGQGTSVVLTFDPRTRTRMNVRPTSSRRWGIS